MPGVSGKLVKKQLFNAKSETAMTLRSFRTAFESSRCLIPMTSWFEWPMRDGKKQKVEIAPKDGRTLLAAGMYEVSKTFDTGEPVATFTMLTTKPSEFLGEVHDRAPLVMLPQHYEDWIAGDAAQAQALIDVHPGSDAFTIGEAA